MRIVVLGGTAWLGREVARHAVAAGHEVACLARGRSGAVAPGTTLLPGDRDLEDGLAALGDGARWDAVVDVSRHPGQVRRAVRDLAGAGHYVFVSTGNVYADGRSLDQDETALVLGPDHAEHADLSTPEGYGRAKVSCEQAVAEGFGDRATVVRAGLIAGPEDTSDRVAHWPCRFAHPSGPAVLVPDVLDQPTAVIDVRDLAAWLVRCATDRVGGVFNACGPVVPMRQHLEVAADVGRTAATIVPVDPPWLVEQGVQHWDGRRSLPLWLPDELRGFTAHRSDRAVAAGLLRRPLEETLADVLAWREQEDRPWSAGLADEEERDLLTAWRGRV